MAAIIANIPSKRKNNMILILSKSSEKYNNDKPEIRVTMLNITIAFFIDFLDIFPDCTMRSWFSLNLSVPLIPSP